MLPKLSLPNTSMAGRFLSSYYVANAMCLASYFLLKSFINWQEAPKKYLWDAGHLWYWEKRTGWMLLALAAGRYMRRSTLDAYLAEVMAYAKLVVVCLLSAADFRLGILLILEVLLVSLMTSQPRYDGTQNVDILTPASFESEVLGTQSSPAATSWFVMFSAPWSSQCLAAAATFADLSLEFGSDRLRFGELDVGRWPKMAKKYGMAIDMVPHQLPAFLLFKQGKLVKRLPPADEAWETKGRLRSRLQEEFELDMVLASGLQSKS